MATKLKESKREQSKLEIRMMQVKKLQQLNKCYKTDNDRLQKENFALAKQFSTLKQMLIEYENQAIYSEIEAQWVIEGLAKENDNLKKLLLINHDFVTSIDDRIAQLEREKQEAELRLFRDLKL